MHTFAKSPSDSRRLDLSRIAQDLQIKKVLVENVVQLLDEENTIPFIARYRKERTGGLDEVMLRAIQERLRQLRKLADRKQTILKSLQLNKLLTPELESAIQAADNPKRLEDLYLPFKKKDKATRADKARERGLTGLADAIWYADPVCANLAELLPTLVNPEKELNTPEEVLAGAHDILAERVAESADVRDIVRRVLWDTGKICTRRNEKLAEGQGVEYKGYFHFTEPLRHIPAHRVLAINRGEKENALQVKIDWDAATGLRVALDRLPLPPEGAVPPPPPSVASPAEAGTPAAASSTTGEVALPASGETAPLASAADSTSAPSDVAPAVAADVAVQAEPTETIVPANATEMPPAANAVPLELGGVTKSSEESATAAPASGGTEDLPTSAVEPAGVGTREGPAIREMEVGRERGWRGQQGRPMPPRRRPLFSHPHAEFLVKVSEDALGRLLVPSLEREVRKELTTRAEAHAVSVFARNLRSKLLSPPLRGKRVLAIDPAFRTGCKLAVLDECGNLLEDGVVFPNPPQNKKAAAKAKLEELIRRHQTPVIAIGNGTACRETEETVAELIAQLAAGQLTGSIAEQATKSAEMSVPPAQAPPPIESAAPAIEAVPAAADSLAQTAPLESTAVVVPSVVTSTLEPAPVAHGESGAVTPAATGPVENSGSTPAARPVDSSGLAPAGPVEDSGLTPAARPEAAATSPTVAVDQQPAAPEPPVASLENLPPPPADLAYIIVNEAGASVYSASPIGREEFPKLDATLRGTISIGRRLQDPLSEMVKIDPQHIGVGLYQHDVHLKQLRESLDGVVETCVNTVGVDLNTASVPLLRHVSGLNQLVARDLVEFRQRHGRFQSREQLKQVPNVGERRFLQAAGFLKVLDGSDPLDRTWVHPESYPLARQLLADLGYTPDVLAQNDRLPELQEKLRSVSVDEVARRLDAGVPTVRDILEALARPGRDPREDLPPPVFKKGVLKIEDLQTGMELQGTVLNVVDFGVFVDVGLKESGLVHISQMANRFVKNPHEVVAVGDVVHVWVMKVDAERHHVSLTMIKPGTERKPAERQAMPVRAQAAPAADGPRGQETPRPRGDHPVRGDRPPRPVKASAVRVEQRQGGDRGGRGPASQGSGRALPPRGSRRQDAASGGKRPAGAKPVQGEAAAAQQQAPPPARKPARKPVPKPNLSQAALTGREALNTFGELAAFWEARTKEPETAEEQATPAPAGEQQPPTATD